MDRDVGKVIAQDKFYVSFVAYLGLLCFCDEIYHKGKKDTKIS